MVLYHLSLHWPNEIQRSLGHWSTSPILSQEYSCPVHPPTYTQTHTPAWRHRASKWGHRWLVVIHLTSMTGAANKSLIHHLIHRLSPTNSLQAMPSQNTLLSSGPTVRQPDWVTDKQLQKKQISSFQLQLLYVSSYIILMKFSSVITSHRSGKIFLFFFFLRQ